MTFPAGISRSNKHIRFAIGLALTATLLSTSAAVSYAATSRASTTSINDTNFTYTGKWTPDVGTNKYLHNDHWSVDAGSTASVAFNGSRVCLYGSKVPDHGYGSIAVDGKTVASKVDWNTSGTRKDGVLIWQSKQLAPGRHTLRITATGNHDALSQGPAINIDRAVVNCGSTASTPIKPTTQTTTRPTVTATGRGKLPSTQSGLAWASGTFIGSGAEANTFGPWRGRPVDIVQVFTTRNMSWGEMSSNFGDFSNTPYAVELSMPPFPDGNSNKACAAGNYNGEWKTIANNLKTSKLDVPNHTVIRMGWEMNIPGWSWSAENSSDYVACWRQIYSAVHPIAPNVLWNWTVNRGENQNGNDPVTSLYPGDAYVDIIGIDSYDAWTQWNDQLNGNGGLNYWLKFAKQHGKKLSAPEWGNYSGTGGQGNGDDPTYITNMHTFFSSNAANIAYESTFNEQAEYCRCGIYPTNMNPKSSAQYKSLWGR